MATTNPIILTTNEAKIILDWDDGQWYVSDIDYTTDGSGTGSTNTATVDSGVKVPEWDSSYKYNENDIVAFEGALYVSEQNQNQDNSPIDGTFWWKPIVDYQSVDALTLEGRNFDEVVRAVLGGNLISDYYKKAEIDNLILTYFNNVNAKKLNDWTLDDIKNDYTSKINSTVSNSEQYVEQYLSDDGNDSFDQSLVTEFNNYIVDDNINQI